jgi:dipeptidyl aminopeptidase/acylaminoacyl peptidase
MRFRNLIRISVFATVFSLPACGSQATASPTEMPVSLSTSTATAAIRPTSTHTLVFTPTARKTTTTKSTVAPQPASFQQMDDLGPIAYYKENSHNNIWLMNPDGSGQHILFTHPYEENSILYAVGFSWSPDGVNLAYSSVLYSDIFIVDTGTGVTENITDSEDMFESYPAWSPDGRTIAFSSNMASTRSRYGVFLMNPDGTNLRMIAECDIVCKTVSWAPSGDFIAFQTTADIYTVKSDGADMRKLTTGGVNQYPAWSPDGRRIAFVRSADYETTGYLYWMNPDGADLAALTDDSLDVQRITWSPDGRFIAFENNKKGGPYGSLWLIDVASKATRAITTGGGFHVPSWNPAQSGKIPAVEINALPDCTNGWSRLEAGGKAKVSGGANDPSNRVRSEPRQGENIIAMIPPGAAVALLEGPKCVGDVVYWRVSSILIPGGIGWTAEGDRKDYWLIPAE